MSSNFEATRSSAGAVLLLALLFTDVHCQTLVGTTADAVTGRGVSNASIALVDVGGVHRAAAISDSLGRFTLVPPTDGEFTIEATRIGYEPTRSPLLALVTSGTAAIDIEMTPSPVGLDGLGVIVEAQAGEFLATIGLTPAAMRGRWVDRDELDAMETPGLLKDVLRWQNVAGLTVTEMDPTQRLPYLCVSLGRGTRGCAAVYLDGARIPLDQAFFIDPRDLEAIAVLTPMEAATFYGTDGGSGVVVMWTRRGHR